MSYLEPAVPGAHCKLSARVDDVHPVVGMPHRWAVSGRPAERPAAQMRRYKSAIAETSPTVRALCTPAAHDRRLARAATVVIAATAQGAGSRQPPP